MLAMLIQSPKAIGDPILGYIIPTVIFLISFAVAFGCYHYFTKKMNKP
jgi:hypothetical protein